MGPLLPIIDLGNLGMGLLSLLPVVNCPCWATISPWPQGEIVWLLSSLAAISFLLLTLMAFLGLLSCHCTSRVTLSLGYYPSWVNTTHWHGGLYLFDI